MLQVDDLDVSLGILILNVCTQYSNCCCQGNLITMYTVYKTSILHHGYFITLVIHYYTEWIEDGCQTAEVIGDVVTCSCNHITNFAILVVSKSICVCCMCVCV